MHKLVSVLLIFAFILPVPVQVRAEGSAPAIDLNYKDPAQDTSFSSPAVKYAALDSMEFVPVERKLIEEQKAIQRGDTKSGSTWWKWALGILLVGGIAAAAGGGGGGDTGTSSSAPTTGTVTGSW